MVTASEEVSQHDVKYLSAQVGKEKGLSEHADVEASVDMWRLEGCWT